MEIKSSFSITDVPFSVYLNYVHFISNKTTRGNLNLMQNCRCFQIKKNSSPASVLKIVYGCHAQVCLTSEKAVVALPPVF